MQWSLWMSNVCLLLEHQPLMKRFHLDKYQRDLESRVASTLIVRISPHHPVFASQGGAEKGKTLRLCNRVFQQRRKIICEGRICEGPRAKKILVPEILGRALFGRTWRLRSAPGSKVFFASHCLLLTNLIAGDKKLFAQSEDSSIFQLCRLSTT